MFIADDVELGAINAIAQLISSLGVELTAQDAARTALCEVTWPFAENPEVERTLVAPWLLNGSIRNDEI